MPVTVGEITALLTVRDEMSAQLKVAQQNVKDLETAFNTVGGSVTKAGQSIEQELTTARTKVDELNAALQTAGGGADELGTKVEAAGGSMEQMDRIATRLIERMAILFALKGVEQFVQGLFTSATKVEDLATQFDLTTDKVQEFQYAAQQTGVPLATLIGAADTLGKKLAGGSDSVSDALSTLGLDTDTFFSADPGERFDQVAKAIGEMGDKTARTAEEMALFGTDKIDPIIKKLQDLEKAAHDSGQVLGFEDVDALAKADKAFESTYNQLKVVSAQLLVGAQDWAAWGFAKLSALMDGTEVSDEDANPDLDPSKNLPPAPGSPKRAVPAPPPVAARGLNPNDPKGMAALDSISKSLTDDVKQREDLEKQEARTLHEIAGIESGRIASAEALLKVTSNMKAELEASQKSMKELATASSAEEAARKSNLGRFGLGTDDEGHTVSQQMLNDPTFQRDQKMKALGREPNTPAGKSNREEQITNEWLDKVNSELTVIVGMTAAEREAASAASKLAAAHDAQTSSVDAANAALMRMSGLSFPTVSSDYSSLGGPVTDGPWLKPMNQGALDFSKPGMSKGLNGPNQTQVTVQGNVYTMDAGGKEAFAQLVSEAVMNSGRQNRRLPSQ